MWDVREGERKLEGVATRTAGACKLLEWAKLQLSMPPSLLCVWHLRRGWIFALRCTSLFNAKCFSEIKANKSTVCCMYNLIFIWNLGAVHWHGWFSVDWVLKLRTPVPCGVLLSHTQRAVFVFPHPKDANIGGRNLFFNIQGAENTANTCKYMQILVFDLDVPKMVVHTFFRTPSKTAASIIYVVCSTAAARHWDTISSFFSTCFLPKSVQNRRPPLRRQKFREPNCRGRGLARKW